MHVNEINSKQNKHKQWCKQKQKVKRNQTNKDKDKKIEQSWGADKFLQFFTKSTKKKTKGRVVEIFFTFFFDQHTYSHTHQSMCTHTSTLTHTLNERSTMRPTERTVGQIRTRLQHFTCKMCHVYAAFFQKHSNKVCAVHFKQWMKERGRRRKVMHAWEKNHCAHFRAAQPRTWLQASDCIWQKPSSML